MTDRNTYGTSDDGHWKHRRLQKQNGEPSLPSACRVTRGLSGMLLIVAVDTETGETKIFDRLSGTSLVDAVSCQLRSTRHMASSHDRWTALHGWRCAFVG